MGKGPNLRVPSVQNVVVFSPDTTRSPQPTNGGVTVTGFLSPTMHSKQVCEALDGFLVSNFVALITDNVGDSPTRDAHFARNFTTGEFVNDSTLTGDIARRGPESIWTSAAHVIASSVSFQVEVKKMRGASFVFPKDEFPSWLFTTIGLMMLLTVDDQTPANVTGFLGASAIPFRFETLVKTAATQGLGNFSRLLPRRKRQLIESANPVIGSGTKSREKDLVVFMDLARANVMRNSFLSKEDYSMAYTMGIQPSQVAMLGDKAGWYFHPVFLDPVMLPELNTCLLGAMDANDARDQYNASLFNFMQGVEDDETFKTDPATTLGDLTALGVRGVPVANAFAVHTSQHNSCETLYTIVFPFFDTKAALETFKMSKTPPDLASMRACRAHTSSAGDSYVSEFLASGTAEVVSRIAHLENKALKKGSILFSVASGDVTIYNAYVKSVWSPACCYSPLQRSLEVVVDGDRQVVARRMFVDAYREFNKIFCEKPNDDVLAPCPRPDFTIIDAEGMMPYSDIPISPYYMNSLIVAPTLADAAALHDLFPQSQIHVHGNGRFIIAQDNPEWFTNVRTVLITFGHLWDSLDFVQTTVALRKAFPNAELVVVGDSHALLQSVARTRQGATGSIFAHLCSEALSAQESTPDFLQPVPRCAAYVGPLFRYSDLPRASIVPQTSAAAKVAAVQQKGRKTSFHLASLMEAAFDTSEAASFTEIVSVPVGNLSRNRMLGPNRNSGIPASVNLVQQLRAHGLTVAVVVDAPPEEESSNSISAYVQNAMRFVDNNPDGPIDLVRAKTVLRSEGIMYQVESIYNDRGTKIDSFSLSNAPQGTCFWAKPCVTATSNMGATLAKSQAVLADESIRPFTDNWEMASVLTLEEMPVSVDVVVFFSYLFEALGNKISFADKGVYMPNQGSDEFDRLVSSVFFNKNDNETLLNLLPSDVKDFLIKSARCGVILGYPDDTPKFSAGPKKVTIADPGRPSTMSGGEHVGDPLKLIRDTKPKKRTSQRGSYNHVASADNTPALSPFVMECLIEAMKEKYGKEDEQGSNKRKGGRPKKNKEEVDDEPEHEDDAFCDGDEEFSDNEEPSPSDLAFIDDSVNLEPEPEGEGAEQEFRPNDVASASEGGDEREKDSNDLAGMSISDDEEDFASSSDAGQDAPAPSKSSVISSLFGDDSSSDT